jgi:hypothetical protein
VKVVVDAAVAAVVVAVAADGMAKKAAPTPMARRAPPAPPAPTATIRPMVTKAMTKALRPAVTKPATARHAMARLAKPARADAVVDVVAAVAAVVAMASATVAVVRTLPARRRRRAAAHLHVAISPPAIVGLRARIAGPERTGRKVAAAIATVTATAIVTAARVARRDRPLRPLSRSPIRCRSRQPRRRSGPSTVAASAS